jgi:hypothetical protein
MTNHKQKGRHMNGDDAPAPTYAAYVLRLWQVETENGPVWRAVLEDPHSGECRGFANLNACCQFLTNKTHSLSPLREADDPPIQPEGERR